MKNAVRILALLAVAILLRPATAQDRYEDRQDQDQDRDRDQDQDRYSDQQDQDDENDATVARMSYIGGEVSYQRGDVDGWNDARVNTPLQTGDAIYAPEGGRAEVELGNGVVLRVDGGTQVELLNNTEDIAQLGMDAGVIDLRTQSFRRNFTIEVDTPSAAVTILERGHYLISVGQRTTRYSAIQGSLSVAVDGQQLDVGPGESLEIENTDSPTYNYTSYARGSEFVTWSDRRASRYERSSSVRYVHEDVVGCEDLDDHGSWRDNREYGRVWVPSGVAAGWAPYQSGRWIWQDPFGWTWVSYENWGWAPYHYGRWAFVDSYWAWVPPPRRGYRGPSVVMSIRPRYAPALVAFIGGSNWSVSVSAGGPAVGWVPLAPAERYYYPWQAPTRVVNNYRNITVINAVTVVNYNTFGTQQVRPIRVPREQLQRAPILGPSVVVVPPTRQSLVPTGRVGAGPTRGRSERPLVARLVPPPKPVSFEQKRTQIERTGKPVAQPVRTMPTVGRPFAAGTPPPAGVRVRSFTGSGPQAMREMKAKQAQGNEGRPPKRIDRDITRPAPSASTAAPAPELPGNRRPAQPPQPEGQRQNQPPPQQAPDARPAPPLQQTEPPRDRRNPRAQREVPPPPAQQAPDARPAPPAQQTEPPRDRRNPRAQREVPPPPPQAAPEARPTPPAPEAQPVPDRRNPRARERDPRVPPPTAQPAPRAPEQPAASKEPGTSNNPTPRERPMPYQRNPRDRNVPQPVPGTPPAPRAPEQPQASKEGSTSDRPAKPQPAPKGKRKAKDKDKDKDAPPPEPPPSGN